MMCVVSMIMDHYGDDWQRRWNDYERQRREFEKMNPPTYVPIPVPMPSQHEIDEFRKLLERAREYDKKNSEPDCEMESKRERVKKLAEELGVKVDFI